MVLKVFVAGPTNLVILYLSEDIVDVIVFFQIGAIFGRQSWGNQS